MRDFPHRYEVSTVGTPHGDTELHADGLQTLLSDSPAQFDGPGDRWSPETLLTGAVADCFILTFRAVARASKLPWTSIRCRVDGTLDRVDRVAQFTRFDVHARLDVPAGTSPALAQRALEKAERSCLITSSLKAATHLTADVVIAEEEEEVAQPFRAAFTTQG